MNLNYSTPSVPQNWSNSRETHPAVAIAIHAIAGVNRSAEAIWEAPTSAEWDHVRMAIEQYIAAGVVEAEEDGRYPWGNETVEI